MATPKSNPMLTYGLINGAAAILFFVILYLMGPESFVNPIAYIFILVPIIISVLACRQQKNANGGFLSFSEALKISFGVFVIGGLVNLLFTYVMMNFVDPGFKEALTQVTAENAAKMTKSFGGSDEQAQKAMEATLQGDNYSLGKQFLSFAIGCIFGFVISLIIAAIMKKNKPEFQQ